MLQVCITISVVTIFWYIVSVVLLFTLVGGRSTIVQGANLQWRQCNGCGRNSPQESRGCDLEYDLRDVSGIKGGNPTKVYPGETFDIPVEDLLSQVKSSHFLSDNSHSFNWKQTGILYHTVSILRPTTSRVKKEPVDRFMYYQELKHSELDSGVIHSYVPALDYSENFGGAETTIMVSMNANPGDLHGTFPVNYYSLESENRLFFCADIKVDDEDNRWLRSDLFQWNVGGWSACVHRESNGRCPYDASPASGIQERDVLCSHPATIPGAAEFIRVGDGPGESQDPINVVKDTFCAPLPKPATRRDCTPPSCEGGNWSKWSATFGVADGDSVIIPSNMSGDVVFDVSTPNLNKLEVRSKSRVGTSGTIAITADSIHVYGGELHAGSSGEPFSGDKFEILLTTNYNPILSRSIDNGPSGKGVLTKALTVTDGGVLSLFGREGVSWTRLVEPALAGARAISLAATEDLSWRVGDNIVISNSDYHDMTIPTHIVNGKQYPSIEVGPDGSMNERRTVTSVDRQGSKVIVGIDSPLDFSHYGGESPDSIGGRSIDQRSEVLWLSRNIQIHGNQPASIADLEGYPSFSSAGEVYSQSGIDPVFGGHIMMAPSANKIELSNVEVGPRMGQAGRLARYPIHFHKIGNKGSTSFVSNCVIHDSFQRSITIHDTKRLRVSNTGSYNIRGHAIFLEDGTETDCDIRGNIVVATKPQMIQDFREDVHDDLPSGYWITNFNNVFEDNVAVGTSRGVGFWFKVDSHSEGELLSHPQAIASSLKSFKSNTAHSNHFSGLWIWHDWLPCTPEINTFKYVNDGPTKFTMFGSTSGDLRMDSDVEMDSGLPAGEFDIIPRNDESFGGNTCSRQPLQILENFTSYKHRDVGTAVYLSTTNIEFKDFTSVSDTTAMAFAQVYRDQTDNGISKFDNQIISGLIVASSSAHQNTLNKARWCEEMMNKGVPGLSPDNCKSECHPWPETSHPSGFPDEYDLPTSSQRYISAVTLSNEGQVGAQIVRGLTLVDFGPNDECGVIDAQGVHVKPGIGLEFPVMARQIHNVKVLDDNRDITEQSPLGRIIRLHGEYNYGNHETVFIGADALGSMSRQFPMGALAMVPAGNDDLFILEEGDGCIDERIYSKSELKIDSILCDVRKIWMTSFSVDFSNTPLYTSGDGPGEIECTPALLLKDFADINENERTFAGVGYDEDAGIGRPDEAKDFYRYRYQFKAAVGKMYLLNLDIENFDDCAALYMKDSTKPTYLTMEKMDYNPEAMGERSFDVVLAVPAYSGRRPVMAWYLDKTQGDYGFLSTGSEIYVPLPSKKNLEYVESSEIVYDEVCCDDILFVHVRLGQRIGGRDTAIEIKWNRDETLQDECKRECSESPWPFAPGFQDTSLEKARDRFG